MKAITLYEPYAWLVRMLLKRIETRSWPTSYRGPLAIHAAKNIPHWLWNGWMYEPDFQDARQAAEAAGLDKDIRSLPRGVIVATCELVDCIRISPDGALFQQCPICGNIAGFCCHVCDWTWIQAPPARSTSEYLFGDYIPGRYAWILADIKPLPEPIPAKGRQGLWEWTPPEGALL